MKKENIDKAQFELDQQHDDFAHPLVMGSKLQQGSYTYPSDNLSITTPSEHDVVTSTEPSLATVLQSMQN